MHIFHFQEWLYTGVYKGYTYILVYVYISIFIYAYTHISIYAYMHIFFEMKR